MSQIKNIARHLRLIFLGGISQEISRITGELEGRINNRADIYERALDTRIDERFSAVERRLDERLATIEKNLDERFDAIEQRFDQRAGSYESALDLRIDERLALAESRFDGRVSEMESRIDQRFNERAHSIDNRLDDRLAKIERQIDERFKLLDQRSDDRMERHERKIDGMVRQMSNDIVERNDLMLQIFEQRLDKQRRELRTLRELKSQPGSNNHHVGESPVASNDGAIETAHGRDDSQSDQLRSFRNLAKGVTHAKTKVGHAGEISLYHQILEWKKVAAEGINDFTPDEQEIVDYILSFVSDLKEAEYVKQHLRRFVMTLQRIPPAQGKADRLLELGSLSHLAPAIKKYCGYQEVFCADFWDSDEKVSHETVGQKNGPDTYTFELHNFNVERDRFPYPDGHFRVALCCELIEHLQSDPMHMLWECNRVLADGGYLLLTTPNITSCRAIEGLFVGCAPYLLAQYNVRETVDQHNREYAPYEVGVALAAAGFTVVELETEDVWLRSNPAIVELLKQIEISTSLRGDNIFALARKTGAPVERYPKELYID